MEITTKQLKTRLREWVTAPRAFTEFPAWFAQLLATCHGTSVEEEAHSIQLLFAMAADGDITKDELRSSLVDYVADITGTDAAFVNHYTVTLTA